ncbi:MAG: hypothetical protein KGO05_09360, partial [Chloroflexota bacterium]|nr:hypothetical protein [Chloroflexota bacterium]
LSFELVAALLWNTAFCLLGYFAGSERERLQLLLERSGWVALVALALGYGVWRLLRWQVARRRAARRLARLPVAS